MDEEFTNYFGLKFLIFISFIEHWIKGFIFGGGSGGVIGNPILFIFRDYKSLSAIRIQVLKTIAILPWSLKPSLGLISDIVFIFGYNKRFFMIFTLIIASFSTLIITTLWINVLSPEFFTVLLFFIFLSIAVNDLLVEAKYSEKIKIRPDLGPKITSFVWGGIFLCEILSIIFCGVIISLELERVLYLIASIPLILIIIPIMLNWLGEIPKNYYSNKIISFDFSKIKKEWKLTILTLILSFLTITIGIFGLLEIEIEYLFILSLFYSVILIIAFNFLVSPVFAKIQTFIIIQNMFTISIETATFFFFTDSKESFPNGPNFSDFFYITVIGIATSFFGFLGVLSYNYFMSEWNYRNIYLTTNLLYMIVSLINIIIYNRWNISIGIPDGLFVIGSESLQHIVGMWNYLPFTLLMSQLCTEGMESTIFAITAGTSNLGTTLSQFQGAFILKLLKINPNGGINDFMNFENLWIACLISAILPCLPLFLIYILIPNVGQKDKINDN